MTDPEDALRDLAEASGSSTPIRPSRSESPLPESDRSDSIISPVTGAPRSNRPDAPPVIDPLADLAEASASMSGEFSGSRSAARDAGSASGSMSHRRHLQKPDVGMINFRSAAVPILMTVGLIMFAMGVWGVLIKLGSTSLPMADQPNVGQLAMLALVGLPMGLLLFAGAWFFLIQLKKDKAKLEAYEANKKKTHPGK